MRELSKCKGKVTLVLKKKKNTFKNVKERIYGCSTPKCVISITFNSVGFCTPESLPQYYYMATNKNML